MASEQGALLLRRQLKVEGFSAGLINDDNIFEVLLDNMNMTLVLSHPPGDDKYGYEKASERWSPVHTVETILISVISMLSSPNDESPANIEAAKEWRDDFPIFKKKVQRIVRRSAEML
ncbi:hypothetical protein NQZ79_g5176 [Umbelopsis isabellina]|nr:hypothetical protein NQZ79_g5176 [Umbelopsis isabellina]